MHAPYDDDVRHYACRNEELTQSWSDGDKALAGLEGDPAV